MIDFTCPHCGNGSTFPDEKAGTEQACPHCGKPVRLPSGAVPGFPGDIRKPAAFAPAAEAGPAADRPPADATEARRAALLVSAMRRPPIEEVHLCAFMKWFFLVIGCAVAIVEIYNGARWYMDASGGAGLEWRHVFVTFLRIFAAFFSGVAMYTIFACLGRIVGSLYVISKNSESRK